MKISFDWLGDFIEITEKDNEKIKAVITANSAEVETMEKGAENLENIIVGKVEAIKKHPNADALQIATVDNGNGKVQVVCGGSNLKEGMKVAFAPIGAVVRWHGSEVMKLEKVKIRGEESHGMICASEEIGLGEMFPKKSEKEIMDLSALREEPGTPLAKALSLDDTVLDIDNHAITNRWDLFSHKGFAREFVANGLGKWKKQKTFSVPVNNNPPPIEIEVHKPSCPRYMGVYMTGLQVDESPDWLKKRLNAASIRSLNNIVDATNYVMVELGVPCHAFDLDRVKGKKWTMRRAKAGEKVTTLDGKIIPLTEEMAIFDDGNELFDFCGIMGGLNSGICEKTNRAWVHVPVYDAVTIRKGARGTGQVTDASIIYEKGVDPEAAPEALARLVELLLQVSPGAKVASRVLDVRAAEPEERTIKLTDARTERVIGCELSAKEKGKSLKDLGFEAKKIKGGFSVTIPSWRMNDVKIEDDLIEEIARIHGYDNIANVMPRMEINPPAVNKKREYEKELKEKLTAFGFNEIYTFAFLGQELLKKCGLEQNAETIEVANPISADISLMRQSLTPRLLETVAANLRFEPSFRLFELSKTYHKKEKGHAEPMALVAATVGEEFRELQGSMEALGFKTLPREPKKNPLSHPGRSAALVLRGQEVGRLFEVHPTVLKNFDIKTRVTVAEVDLQKIHDMKIERRPKYEELPKFPASVLDVSIAIPRKELAQKYGDAIAKTDKTLIADVALIDEYAGEKMEKGKRSLTFSVTYRAADRTLTEAEVNAVHQKALESLKHAGAEIR